MKDLLRKKLRLLGMLGLLCCIMLLAACDSIGGADLNKTMRQLFSNQSYEGAATIEWEIDLRSNEMYASYLGDDFLNEFKPYQKGSLQITELKVQDASNASMRIQLRLNNRVIPLDYYLQDGQELIKLDGVERYLPAELLTEDYQSIFDYSVGGDWDFFFLSNASGEPFIKQWIDLVPNLTKTSAAPATRTIQGESVALTEINASMNGYDLPDWMISLIDRILKEEKLVKALIKSMTEAEGLMPVTDDWVNEEFDEMKKYLQVYREDIAIQDDTMVHMLTKKANNIDVRLGIDSRSDLRTISADLGFRIPSEYLFLPVRGFKLKVTGELWNMNKKIEAKKPSSSMPLLTWSEVTGSNLLKLAPPSSDLYKFLKEDLKANVVKMEYHPDRFRENMRYFYGNPFINEEQTMMIGARNLADDMGYSLDWNAEKKQLVLSDSIMGTSLMMTLGSKMAELNGSAWELSTAPVLVNGVTYIPVRSAAEALGMQLTYHEDYGRITLTREQ
jgi:hypothetical protein